MMDHNNRSSHVGSDVKEPKLSKFYQRARSVGVSISLIALSGCITDLTVSRHGTENLSNQAADQIFNDFTQAVQISDSSADFACASDFGSNSADAIYQRSGSVGVYNGPSVINTAADFSAVNNQPGYAKVVGAINWCGGPGPNIIGCAQLFSNTFAVVRFTANQEGLLWAHEFGHTTGLQHRNGARTLMNSFIQSDQREVNSFECLSLVSKSSDAAAFEESIAEYEAQQATTDQFDGEISSQLAGDDDVVKFVSRTYIHGTPMDEAQRFQNSESIATLLLMLNNAENQNYHGNIAAVLGMIGDNAVAKPLMDFVLKQRTQEQDGQSTRATTAALMGLGYLANRSDNSEVVTFLSQASAPLFWEGTEEQSRQNAVGAAFGLAFSGRTEGRNALSQLARNNPAVDENLKVYLLEVNQQVAADGIAAFYAK